MRNARCGADLLVVLRQSTHDLHRQLEGRMTPEGPWTLAAYETMLRAFYRVIAPVEHRLAELLGDLFVPPAPPTRTDRIRLDLAAITGADPDANTGSPAGLSLPPGVPIRSHADAFGVGYVLQGSLLGGAVIARQLRRDQAHRPVSTCYFDLYDPDGGGLGAAWRRFCAALTAFGATATVLEHQHAEQAAVATFRAFDAALDRAALDRR